MIFKFLDIIKNESLNLVDFEIFTGKREEFVLHAIFHLIDLGYLRENGDIEVALNQLLSNLRERDFKISSSFIEGKLKAMNLEKVSFWEYILSEYKASEDFYKKSLNSKLSEYPFFYTKV